MTWSPEEHALRRVYHHLTSFEITSEKDGDYNCIAWALGVIDRWWAPDPDRFWPSNVSRTGDLESFVTLFKSHGYEECESGYMEVDIEKVAIYCNHGEFTHVARQLPSGKWTSKLGTYEDIEHKDLVELTGPLYGSVFRILKRRRGNG